MPLSSVVTIFRNRLRAGAADAYGPVATEMTELARTMPGFVDSKTFTAADGERVTVVTFADRASHDAWRLHPDHVEAQREGIEKFYETYAIQVAEVTRSHTFTR